MQTLLGIVAALVLTEIASLATSIYLHRALAHKSIVVHPVTGIVFRTILWLTTGQSRQQWVAIHRKHHAFTDCEGDPHSPHLLGFWRVQLFNVAYYIREARNPETLETFAPDLRPDRLDRMLFSHGLVGVGVGLTLLCAIKRRACIFLTARSSSSTRGGRPAFRRWRKRQYATACHSV